MKMANSDYFSLLIYMKSGNVLRCDHVTAFDWGIEKGEKALKIQQKIGGHTLFVGALDCNQIEGIVRVDEP